MEEAEAEKANQAEMERQLSVVEGTLGQGAGGLGPNLSQ